nr:helix-turn-helix domain-containing protein [Kibdelosporangium sp. MJ126-NF4]CEL19108.1 Transcriptional regulator containing an amidase domain and an AraC-type DNA-binding HTH domain [Kibdelosporangium sp. MJ126-NF4]CTQ95090.1 Transcriptional regulator containing an amidase domain and an AraC-type DNA-binding HTH domain [Kibdelosporangium sp. MJ126-NF4]
MAHRVVVLARPGVLPLELGLIHSLFNAAGGRYEVITCGLAAGQVRVKADFALMVEHGPEALANADTVVIPAAYDPHDNILTAPLTGRLATAMSMIRPGARIASVCTGAFVLAAAGLLDGRPATTHWEDADAFRRTFPEVHLDADVLYTDDGDVLTSAGGAAGIDLCLHLIRRDFGAAVAVDVARRNVVPPHRDGGQAQFIERPVADDGASSTTGIRTWLLDHLGHGIDLDGIARRSGLSKRTLTRRFRDETGMSPMQWLTQQRLVRARQLLERTDMPVDRVAEQAGFGTGGSLRLHLQDALGVSPTAYRATFRGPTSR